MGAKAGQTGQDARSAAQPSIMGPCGTTKSPTTMAVAVIEKNEDKEEEEKEGGKEDKKKNDRPPQIYALEFVEDWKGPLLSASLSDGNMGGGEV